MPSFLDSTIRQLMLGLAIMTMAGCGDNSSATSGSSETKSPPDAEALIAARSYLAALTSGDAESAYDYLSEQCKEKTSKREFAATVTTSNARLVFIKPTVEGDKAKLTFQFDQSSLDRTDVPWVLEKDELAN